MIELEGPLWFISKALGSEGVVFVHCLAGASRSASIVIGYLMKVHGMTLKDAMDKVVTCRPCVSPNPSYLRQLVSLDVALYGKVGVPVPQLPKLWKVKDQGEGQPETCNYG